MSFQFKIDSALGSVITTFSGTLANKDVGQLKDKISEDPEFNPAFNHLVDLRKVTDIQLSSGNIQAMASARIFKSTSKTAFIVDGDLQYGVSRIFKAWRDNDSTMEVFRSIDDGVVWLTGKDST